MKIVLVAVSGFVFTLTTYAAGILTAVFFLNAEPPAVRSRTLDATEVWTNEPVVVDAASQKYERLDARPTRELPSIAVPQEANTQMIARIEPLVDVTKTGAILPAPTSEAEQAGAPSLNTAHVEWCSAWYRSYRPSDNSYTSYSGKKRECISPYSRVEEEGSQVQASVDRPLVGYAMEDEQPSGYLTSEHVQSCFDRYRSYRPEDNTYQPYGGGPRRQCR